MRIQKHTEQVFPASPGTLQPLRPLYTFWHAKQKQTDTDSARGQVSDFVGQTTFIPSSLQPAAFIMISHQFQLDPGQTLLGVWESVRAERQIPAGTLIFPQVLHSNTHLNLTLIKHRTRTWTLNMGGESLYHHNLDFIALCVVSRLCRAVVSEQETSRS